MAIPLPFAGSGGNRPNHYQRRSYDPFASIRRNHRIKVPQVRVISPEGKQLGVIDTSKAVVLALEVGMDLVEVAPNATPPVCRIMDFGKYVYEEQKKHSHAKTTASKIKEIEFSARIEQHDFFTKLRHAEEFLHHGNKVKLRLKFRGREMAHTEIGFEVVKKAVTELVGMGHPDAEPKLIGRNIHVMLTPLPTNKRKRKFHPEEEEDEPAAAPLLSAAAMLPGALRLAALGALFYAVGADAAPLPTVRISGADYVSVEDAAGALGRPRIDFEPESREIAIDGVRVFLGEPALMRDGRLYVSRIDFEDCLAPRLRPALGGPPPPHPKIIVLDPGHGGADHGTENMRLGLMEKTFTLDVALRLRKLLEDGGYRVIMTRDGDYDVSKPMRAETANRAHADLFMSIHFNAVPEPDTKTSGSEVFSLAPATQRSSDSWGNGTDDRIMEPSPGNRNDRWSPLLAHAVYREVLRSLHTVDHGEKIAHWAVLIPLDCPGILVESAFLSNDAEAQRVATPAFRQQIAEALAAGIHDYGAALDALQPQQQKKETP